MLRQVKLIKNKKAGFTLAGAVAIILAVLCVTPVGVYATNLIIDKVFVTEHTISVGNPKCAEDMAYSISLRNTANKRDYISPISGIEFSLVDEVTEGEEIINEQPTESEETVINPPAEETES